MRLLVAGPDKQRCALHSERGFFDATATPVLKDGVEGLYRGYRSANSLRRELNESRP